MKNKKILENKISLRQEFGSTTDHLNWATGMDQTTAISWMLRIHELYSLACWMLTLASMFLCCICCL